MTDDALLLREEEAYMYAVQIADAVTRNIVLLAIARARMAVLRRPDGTDQTNQHLPSEAFDMIFFAHVIASAFADHALVRRVLDGEDLAGASGWEFS